ncbi:hypothetical protein Ahia01_000905900, partial [Argonauta hians]
TTTRDQPGGSSRGFKSMTSVFLQGPSSNGTLSMGLSYKPGLALYGDLKAAGSLFKPVTAVVDINNNERDKYVASATLTMGNTELYHASLNATMEAKQSGLDVFRPVLRVSARGKVLLASEAEYTMAGYRTLLVVHVKKVNFGPALTIKKPIVLNVGVHRRPRTVQGKFALKTGAGVASMTYKVGPQSRILLNYKFGPRYTDKIILSTKVQTSRTMRSATYRYGINMYSQKRAILNFNAKSHTTWSSLGKFTSSLVLQYTDLSGKPRPKPPNNLKLNTQLNYNFATGPAYKCDYVVTLTDASKDIDFKVESSHFHTKSWPPKKMSHNVKVQVAPRHIVETSLLMSHLMVKGRRTADVKYSLSYPGQNIEFSEELRQNGPM